MFDESFWVSSEANIVIIIGMWNSGKSSVANYCSNKIGATYIDMDKEIELSIGVSIEEYLKTHSWEDFWEAERVAFLKQMQEALFWD